MWVGEYLSAGAAAEAGGVPAELLEAGRQMRDALLRDLQAWGSDGGDAEAEATARAAPRGAAQGAQPPGPMAARRQPLRLSYAQGPGVAPPADLAARGLEPPRAIAPLPNETALDFLAREALGHDLAWLVAPEIGGALETLARAIGPRRWVGSTPEAIAVAGRKRATLERLAAGGILTPLALDGGARAWVVKPDDGAGTTDTRRHAGRAAAEADLAARRERGEPATLEPWVEGEAMSLSLRCRRGDAPELLAINRQRIECDAAGLLRDDGVSICAVPLDDPRAAALRELAQGVALALPRLRAFVGIDFVWHAQRGPVLIEVNPRLTCAFAGLSAKLGRSLAAEILADHLEEHAEDRPAQALEEHDAA